MRCLGRAAGEGDGAAGHAYALAPLARLLEVTSCGNGRVVSSGYHGYTEYDQEALAAAHALVGAGQLAAGSGGGGAGVMQLPADYLGVQFDTGTGSWAALYQPAGDVEQVRSLACRRLDSHA